MSRRGVRGFSPSALRRRRTDKGLSLDELALVSGVGVQSLRAWEASRSYPSPHNLAAVAKALKTPVADFLVIPEDDVRLGDLRARQGLTQGDVATQLGVSVSYVSSLESGWRAATAGQVEALAGVYDVTAATARAVAEHTRLVALRRAEAK